MSSLSESMNFEPLRSLIFSSISGSYALVGAAAQPAVRIIMVSNYTDKLLTFSIDGVNDHFVLEAGASLTLDLCSNRTSKAFYMNVGKSVYVKNAGSNPTTGSVYFSTIYGENRSTFPFAPAN